MVKKATFTNQTFSPSPEQAQQLQALGIDLSKIDWRKIGTFLQLLLQLWLSQNPQPMTGKALEHCTHEECCCAAVCASFESLQAAIHAHETCHQEPGPTTP